MKKTKVLLSALLALVMVISVAACGTPAAPGNRETDTTASTGKEIVYWSMWESTEPQAQVIKAAVEAYQKDTGNTVKLEFKGRNGMRDGLEPALDSGTVIDMFDEDIDRVNKNWGKWLMDLEPMVKESGYEKTASVALMNASRIAGDGTLKTIPYQPYLFGFFYHPQQFQDAGIEAVPTTWDEFMNVCQKLKDLGIAPMTNDDAYMTGPFGFHLARLLTPEQVKDVVDNNRWNHPAVLETAKAFEEMASRGYFSENIASNKFPAGQNGEFALAEVGMYLDGSWVANEVRSITGDGYEWGFFNYPELPNGVNGLEAANYGSQCLGINKDSKVSAEAFELITYITKGEYDMELANTSIGIPADSSNTEWPAPLAAVRPVMESLTTRIEWAGGIENNPNTTPALKENIAKLCGGSITAEQFVENMLAATSN